MDVPDPDFQTLRACFALLHTTLPPLQQLAVKRLAKEAGRQRAIGLCGTKFQL
jgi:hypothetical protein